MCLSFCTLACMSYEQSVQLTPEDAYEQNFEATLELMGRINAREAWQTTH